MTIIELVKPLKDKKSHNLKFIILFGRPGPEDNFCLEKIFIKEAHHKKYVVFYPVCISVRSLINQIFNQIMKNPICLHFLQFRNFEDNELVKYFYKYNPSFYSHDK